MTVRATALIGAALLVLLAPVAIPAADQAEAEQQATTAVLEDQLRETETAFAQTMADRDPTAFVSFLAEEAVFFGRQSELRGREAVAAAWLPLFEGPQPPFSWRPEVVAVLSSGDLGLTSGPVLDAEGKRIATFNSVWRRQEDGSWKIVFDRGCPPCGGD